MAASFSKSFRGYDVSEVDAYVQSVQNFETETENNLAKSNQKTAELEAEVKDKMKDTLLPYQKDITKNNVLNVFNSFVSKRKESIVFDKEQKEKTKEKESGRSPSIHARILSPNPEPSF